MKAEQMRDVTDVCRMLSDETRAAIAALLSKGPRSVTELCRQLELPRPTTSYHLGLLRMTGLLRRERKGKRMSYSLNRQKLTPVRKFLAKLT